MASVSSEDTQLSVAPEASLVLPAFFMQRPDGVFIDLTRLESESELARIVDRIFANGYICLLYTSRCV